MRTSKTRTPKLKTPIPKITKPETQKLHNIRLWNWSLQKPRVKTKYIIQKTPKPNTPKTKTLNSMTSAIMNLKPKIWKWQCRKYFTHCGPKCCILLISKTHGRFPWMKYFHCRAKILGWDAKRWGWPMKKHDKAKFFHFSEGEKKLRWICQEGD